MENTRKEKRMHQAGVEPATNRARGCITCQIGRGVTRALGYSTRSMLPNLHALPKKVVFIKKFFSASTFLRKFLDIIKCPIYRIIMVKTIFSYLFPTPRTKLSKCQKLEKKKRDIFMFLQVEYLLL
jgi:hypothetical protein